jgi:hypothetical protein
MHCSVRIQSPCDGTIHAQLFGNARVFAQQVRAVPAGPTAWDIDVPLKPWTAALSSPKLPFQTLLLAVGGILVCSNASDQYPFADAFMAGFASGE